MGGTRGALQALSPTKFVSAHRNLVFHNRNICFLLIVPPQLSVSSAAPVYSTK